MVVSFEEYVKEALKRAIYCRNKDKKGYTVTVPDLAGCVSWGETIEEARDMIKDAIEGWVITALQFGDSIPVLSGKSLAGLKKRRVKGLAQAGRYA